MSGSHGTLKSGRALLFVILALAFLSGCTLPKLPISLGTAPSPTTASLEATLPPATPTAPSPRTLTVCLGEEPNTLYPFAGPNDAALSVLAAIDDGPIDTISYDYQPVILTKLPTLADGDAKILPVDVRAGSKIVDANGTLNSLAAGVQVRPS